MPHKDSFITPYSYCKTRWHEILVTQLGPGYNHLDMTNIYKLGRPRGSVPRLCTEDQTLVHPPTLTSIWPHLCDCHTSSYVDDDKAPPPSSPHILWCSSGLISSGCRDIRQCLYEMGGTQSYIAASTDHWT